LNSPKNLSAASNTTPGKDVPMAIQQTVLNLKSG
jgi:hypothetical protein